ncbi:helix-turn-helix transcriptional regulator [Anaerococcus sp. mt242]|uniref:helix-turn-helix transcriptional regulator n=1 Tax=Anaerococcus sp. mt242 TaxID=2661917 RepID=UPI0019338140|nr:helix-turn-helix transcriptional regulator [Anaerococcus sp. mt242]MBM0046984.1 helix-turn-helix transcriptional regulator [Anaerococcus sp. mt242]
MIIDNDYSFIGSDIRKIRESKGITRKEIAENLYISEETIRRIEKGDNDPRISTLVPICNYLGIDIKDFINDTEFEYKNLLSLRKEIGDLLNNDSMDKAKTLIKSLDNFDFSKNIAYERELYATKHYFNGLMGIKNNAKLDNSSDDLENALSDLNSRFKVNKFKNYKYDDFSLRILLALALNEYKKGNFDLYKDIMAEMSGYVNSSIENYFVFCYNLAVFYARIGKYEQSLNVCNQAIGSAKIVKETTYLNMLYYAKGINHLYLHEYDRAKESFEYCKVLTNIFASDIIKSSLSNQIDSLLVKNN